MRFIRYGKKILERIEEIVIIVALVIGVCFMVLHWR
jgi:hypothetical protein